MSPDRVRTDARRRVRPPERRYNTAITGSRRDALHRERPTTGRLRRGGALWYATDMATQLGKRYLCDTCGAEVLCNKPGGGELSCCDHEMKLKEAKPLPSSD